MGQGYETRVCDKQRYEKRAPWDKQRYEKRAPWDKQRYEKYTCKKRVLYDIV